MTDWILFGSGNGNEQQGLCFLHCPTLSRVKLGITSDPLAYARRLRVNRPTSLEILYFTGLLGRRAKTSLIQTFAKYHAPDASRDWFHWSDYVQAYLQGVIWATSGGHMRLGLPFPNQRPDPQVFGRGARWARKHGRIALPALPREDPLWRRRFVAQLLDDQGALQYSRPLRAYAHLPPSPAATPEPGLVDLPPGVVHIQTCVQEAIARLALQKQECSRRATGSDQLPF